MMNSILGEQTPFASQRNKQSIISLEEVKCLGAGSEEMWTKGPTITCKLATFSRVWCAFHGLSGGIDRPNALGPILLMCETTVSHDASCWSKRIVDDDLLNGSERRGTVLS
jgi:hypothetical protein